jgi:peptide/nickel transport system substrate-binding protein
MRSFIFVSLVFFSLLPFQTLRVAYAVPPSPYELVVDTITGASPITFDPANCYDVATGELLFNVYETLIFFDGERYDYFISQLAEQVWVAPPDLAAPEYTNFTIYFKIRVGVPFHTWCRSDLGTLTWTQYYLTTADVEHSLERLMVYDYLGGPQWMIYEALLGCYEADPTDPTFGAKIDNAIQSNSTHVWLNIANDGLVAVGPVSFAPVTLFETNPSSYWYGRTRPAFWNDVGTLPLGYPLRILFQVISQPWASIMSKQWLADFVDPLAEAAGHPTGEWLGTWENWTLYHYPTSPLEPELPCIDMIPASAANPGVACGTGPYVLDKFDAATEWSVVKFDDYWGGWPAKWPNIYGCKPAGWVTKLTVRQRSSSACRAELINGDCDFAHYVSSSSWSSFHVNGDIWNETLNGIRLQYWQAPELEVQSFFFTFNITPAGDTYGRIYDYGVLSEDGIPRDFFSNIHVRKAFAYCINSTYLINELLKEIAYQPITFAPSGLPYVNLTQSYYSLYIEKAKEEFALAWNGQLLSTGFTITLPYPNTFSASVCQNIAQYIVNIGNEIASGKFHVQLKMVSWSQFPEALQRHELPTFMVGWLSDYADIHNFAYSFLHSNGAFASFQNYKNQAINDLIDNGVRVPDGPLRQAIYYQLEELYYEDVPSVPLYSPVTRCYLRDRVYGYYYNALYPGIFAYNIWKWTYQKGDVNYDGKVSMTDIVTVVNSFGSYAYKDKTFAFHSRWNFHCDIDDSPRYRWRDQKIDMGDITQICSNFGKTSVLWQPPP